MEMERPPDGLFHPCELQMQPIFSLVSVGQSTRREYVYATYKVA